MIDGLVDDKLCVCSAEVSSHDGKVSNLLVSLFSLLLKPKPMQFWLLNVLPDSRFHSRTNRCLLAFWFMCHVTWATCRTESGRRCWTLSKRVSLETICAVTHTLELMQGSLPGTGGCSRMLPHMSGHQACWGGVRGRIMYPLREYDHLGVAIETLVLQKRWLALASASIQFSSW